MHKNQDRAQKKRVKNCKIEAKRGSTEGGKHAAALKFFFKVIPQNGFANVKAIERMKPCFIFCLCVAPIA